MIEVSTQINAVRREVGTRVLEAGEARTMTISQSYDTTVEDLWDACTTAERIARWFLPVTGDLRVGGRFQVEGNASGVIERCDPPRSFAATWEFGKAVNWIEVRVSAQDDGLARLELEHTSPVDEMWASFGPGAVGMGWDLALIGLAIHMSTGQPADPHQAAGWLKSPDGQLFMTQSSDRWRAASVSAGTGEAEAAAAADRCAAAYGAGPAVT